MTENTVEQASFRPTPGWLAALVVGVSGLFYAYAIWNAIAHIIAMSQPDGLTVTGWITLVFGAIFPAIVFALAWVFGRRRNVGELALVMLTGLAVVAVFWLSLVGYSILNMETLVVLP
ncbi:hypothetical protein OED01_06745 [Microbacterium sp. M28]|uniref:hypothetical protein n=1 Tax=Microbacterium sp. M28 TaxID=2962064 RepID=UPI0021F3F9ED|nr:hypothetical protein [Microbacterium sp. M28]UYO98403.1 hypothetical protein OED01_06745 [Microbacterium sp. M28]